MGKELLEQRREPATSQFINNHNCYGRDEYSAEYSVNINVENLSDGVNLVLA